MVKDNTQPEEEVKEKAPKAEALKKDEPKEDDAKKTIKRSKKKTVIEGNVHVSASFNNTIVSFTDPKGNVISWSSAGGSGFKGSRKSTPYAAQVAAENAAQKAQAFGFERAHVYVKGIGSGREQAVRALISAGIELLSITDRTPLPHNGCRKKKARRV